MRKSSVADVPLKGCTVFLSQHADHQILFVEFGESVDLPAHLNGAQCGIVLLGKEEPRISGKKHIYAKGDKYFINEGVVYSSKIYAG